MAYSNRVLEFKNSEEQGLRAYRVLEFKDSKVYGLRGSGVWGLEFWARGFWCLRTAGPFNLSVWGMGLKA